MIVSSEKNLLIVILMEEINMDESCVNEYLNIREITIIGQYFSYDRNTDKKDIISQINLIVELHKILIGCNFNGMSRIKSTIGKEVEDYKVQIKKLQKHYDYVANEHCPNEVDKLILSNGKIMLNQAKEALNYIYGHDYFGVIKRSMNREEICIGKVDRNNLRKNEGKIEIGTIKGMTYNLVEEDLYNYIKKLQRKQFDIDKEELIKLFVHGSHLSFNSFDYLRGLCSYPRDFLKTWERYRDIKKENANQIDNELDMLNVKYKCNKMNKDNDEILLELKKSLKYESKGFII